MAKSAYIKSAVSVQYGAPTKACRAQRLWSVAALLKAYAKAKLSGRGASPEVVAARLKSCHACPSYCKDGDRGWCGACGCGSNRKEAIIEGGEGPSKLTFVKLDCPRKRAGFSNAETQDE